MSIRPSHESGARQVGSQHACDAKVRLYGESSFARSYFRRTTGTPVGRLIHDAECAILRSLIPAGRGQHVLDVGTGNGRLLPVLGELGYRPVGVDLSRAMLQADPALHTSRVLGDAWRLPIGDATVAGVLGHRLLYHYQAYQVLLAELTRVLAPGGWLCVDVLRWTPSGLARRAGVRSGRLVRPIDPAALEQAASQLGLDVRGRRAAFALNPASATLLPPVLGRWVAQADALPWIPRVKQYVLLQRGAARAGPELELSSLTTIETPTR
jgi:SAM-dependent methyltransferase